LDLSLPEALKAKFFIIGNSVKHILNGMIRFRIQQGKKGKKDGVYL